MRAIRKRSDFRQPDNEDDREEERCAAADIENGLPAEMRNDIGRSQRADQAAEWKRRKGDGDKHAALARGGEFAAESEKAWHRTAEPEAGAKTKRQKFGQRGRRSGQQAEDAEYDDRRDHEALAAESIGQRPEAQRSERGPDQPGREYRAEHFPRQIERLPNRRRSVADRLRVVAVDRRRNHAQYENADLISGDRVTVDSIVYIDDGGHCFSPGPSRSRIFALHWLSTPPGHKIKRTIGGEPG